MSQVTDKQLAEWLHDQYEEIAKEKKWETQEQTRVSFDNLPEENKKTMIELANRIITRFKINTFGRYWR